MQTDKKIPLVLVGLILCGILLLGFYWAGHLPGTSLMKDNLPQTGSVQPSATVSPDTAIITVNPIPEYTAGKTITIGGTTTLPVGEVLDIAWIKEPFHTTKCDSGKFCGSGTYSTIVTVGGETNVWSLALNTTGFNEGGYDIWVVAKNSPNISVHAGLNLRNG
jgi:hypothetical protein